jgi:hypothetical protein
MAGLPATIIISPSIAPPEENVKEALAGGVITPGNLLQKTPTGTVVRHATAGANSQRIFALQNLGDAEGIDVEYISGETTRYVYAKSGWEIYATVVNGTAVINQGDAVQSNGGGNVATLAADIATDADQRESIVGYALETVDNSGGAAVVRIRIEVA